MVCDIMRRRSREIASRLPKLYYLQNCRVPGNFSVILAFAFPEISIGTWAQSAFDWATLYFHVLLFACERPPVRRAAVNIHFARRDTCVALSVLLASF